MEGYQLYDLYSLALSIVLIIGLVLTVQWFKKKENDNKTKVLLSALEKGQEVNPELLTPGKKKVARNKWKLLLLLIGGSGITIFSLGMLIITIVDTVCKWGTVVDGHVVEFNSSNFMACVVFLALGMGLLVGYFVGKKLLKPELEKEGN